MPIFDFFKKYFIKNCYSKQFSRVLVVTIEFATKFRIFWHMERSVAHDFDDFRVDFRGKMYLMKNLDFFKRLYLFKNSMFKHSYRDGVDPLRSALKKESPYRKFHWIPSKSNLFRAKSMFYSEFARWLFCIFCPLPRGDLPPHVFLPRPRWSDPTGRGRRGTTRKQQQHQRHDGVAQRPRCHHRAQGSSVNPFGYPPLSDMPWHTEYIPNIYRMSV